MNEPTPDQRQVESDLRTEIFLRDKRIEALEKLCATLSAEVDQQRGAIEKLEQEKREVAA